MANHEHSGLRIDLPLVKGHNFLIGFRVVWDRNLTANNPKTFGYLFKMISHGPVILKGKYSLVPIFPGIPSNDHIEGFRGVTGDD